MPTLYVVATPIGNLQDFSPRAIQTLSEVQLIAAEDTGHTLKLLNHFSIRTPMISYHKYNEAERAGQLIRRMREENIDVALVTDAGTPCISDPGFDLVKAARQGGIPVIGIPGPSAAVTALSISGFPTDNFAFIGFLPREKQPKAQALQRIKDMPVTTFVLYESPLRIKDTLKDIAEVLDCEACLCNDLTKLHEASLWGNIREVLERVTENPKSDKGEYVLILYKPVTDSAPETTAPALSPEALLVDEMVRRGCSLKEAIAYARERENAPAKKELYNASIRLKELFE